jgi:drug/metabolite transporter (DMT)-like permease
MKKMLVVMAFLGVLFTVMPDPVMAEAKLPSYATSGSVDNQAQAVGKKVTDFLSLGVGILAIIGMLVGAAFFSVGYRERGWQMASGGFVGLVVAGLVYGLAGLAA